MKTFIIIAVMSLAVAGMSFAAPMSKQRGPWKSTQHSGKSYSSQASSGKSVGRNVKQIPHRHSAFSGSSHARLQRLHSSR